MAAENSVIEDIARMRELRELFDLIDDIEPSPENHFSSSVLAWLSCISPRPRRFIQDEDESEKRAKQNHQHWLNIQKFIAELRVNEPDGDGSSLIYRFKQLVNMYTEIRYPNFVAVIQPKLDLINSIEA